MLKLFKALVGHKKWILIWNKIHVNSGLKKGQKFTDDNISTFVLKRNFRICKRVMGLADIFNIWRAFIFTILEVRFKRKMIEFVCIFFSSNSSLKKKVRCLYFSWKKGYVCHIQAFRFKKEIVTYMAQNIYKWPRLVNVLTCGVCLYRSPCSLSWPL